MYISTYVAPSYIYIYIHIYIYVHLSRNYVYKYHTCSVEETSWQTEILSSSGFPSAPWESQVVITTHV